MASAIEKLGADKQPVGVKLLVGRVRKGLPSSLVEKAVDSIKAIGGRSATLSLIELSRHRTARVRVKTAQGLASVRGPGAMKTLIVMLDDSVPEVRAAAANAIGDLGARRALNELMSAAGRGLTEAAEVLGEQVKPIDVPKLLKKVDDQSVGAFAPALSIAVKRKDLSKKSKLAVVERLERLLSPQADTLLREIASALPEDDRVGRAARDALSSAEQPEQKEKR